MIYGINHNKKFTDIFENVTAFTTFYNEYVTATGQTYQNFPTAYLYYLLYGNYGNSTIANNDENKFKFKLMGIVLQYGPTWAKKLEIQKSLYGLTEAEAMQGYRTINNHAYAPAEEQAQTTTATSETELTYINDQNATIQKKSKLNALTDLYNSLEDVTSEFMNKFKVLFLTIVNPELPLLYESDIDEESED